MGPSELGTRNLSHWTTREVPERNSRFTPLIFQFPPLTAFPIYHVSLVEKKLESAMTFFFLPHPTGQKILLALPLTYVQILTASCCHLCYPSHATKTSCLGFCGRPALAACVFLCTVPLMEVKVIYRVFSWLPYQKSVPPFCLSFTFPVSFPSQHMHWSPPESHVNICFLVYFMSFLIRMQASWETVMFTALFSVPYPVSGA